MGSLDSRDVRTNRLRTWFYIAWLFFFFMLGGLFAGSRSRTPLDSLNSPSQSSWFSTSSKWLSFPRNRDSNMLVEHPIPKLMADAEQKFKALLLKQSKTLSEAVAEYRRRYGRNPPRGFDEWWKFATENNVKLTDEFGAIAEDLEPFWILSGEEFRGRAYEVWISYPMVGLM